MMATVVPSRFACLKIEGDDEPFDKKPDQTKGKKVNNIKTTAQKKTAEKKNKNGTSKPTQPICTNNGNTALNKNKKKKPVPEPKTGSGNEWEQWKQKDSKFVDGHYEDELEKAILLSKLDFEENTNVCKEINKPKEKTPDPPVAKNKAMTLGEFNDFVDNVNGRGESQSDVVPPQAKEPVSDNAFFDRIRLEVKIEAEKEKQIKRVKPREQPSDEVITRSQFKAALDKKTDKIKELNAKIKCLEEDLKKTKEKNIQLCNYMVLAEMQEKFEILENLERVNTIRSELSEENTYLHGQLEQARSQGFCGKTELRSKEKKRRAVH